MPIISPLVGEIDHPVSFWCLGNRDVRSSHRLKLCLPVQQQ